MKRHIKFRAYDKELKQMLTPEEINYYYIGDANQEEFLPFMQYTGLKDKNGVEIYEGDIIKLCDNMNGNFQVIFKNQYVGGWILSHKDGQISLGVRNKNELEVIGNIYENEELLDVRS